MAANTIDTRFTERQRNIINEEITKFLWDNFNNGEVDFDRHFLIKDIDDGIDCEVSLTVKGEGWTKSSYDLPPVSGLQVQYEGSAEFFKVGTLETLYSAPIERSQYYDEV